MAPMRYLKVLSSWLFGLGVLKLPLCLLHTSCIASQITSHISYLFLLRTQSTHVGYLLLVRSLGSSHDVLGILEPSLQIVLLKGSLLLLLTQPL